MFIDVNTQSKVFEVYVDRRQGLHVCDGVCLTSIPTNEG